MTETWTQDKLGALPDGVVFASPDLPDPWVKIDGVWYEISIYDVEARWPLDDGGMLSWLTDNPGIVLIREPNTKEGWD